MPDTLHERLAEGAKREGVSLNHYIVYSLTRTVTAADLEHQRSRFEELTRRYPPEEAEVALRELLASRKPS
jgi:hypothetical protein